jgi:flagellar biosynthesis protein FlhF
MRVHTFIADSANDAVNRIRAELGPAAVVLSVRKLPRTGLERFVKQHQIEVLAGIDESPAPEPALVDPLAEVRAEIQQLRRDLTAKIDQRGNDNVARNANHKNGRSNMAHLLAQTGIMPAFAEQIVQELPRLESHTLPEQITALSEALRQHWRDEPRAAEADVHIFVGVPGSGKSTVLCKMLAQTSLLQGQPATVYQLDSHLANPASLPSVYAEVVGAQFERTSPLEFERREESVFVDLPGVTLRNSKALEHLKSIISIFGIPQIHLVLNAAYEPMHLLEQVRFFSSLGIADLIVTHLDEESRWGKLWNLVLGTDLNIRALGTGQNIPGDFHPANPDVILSRQFAGK